MEFRILGPVEASSGGQPLELGGARQRALLASLLLHANEVVSADRLLDELWAEPPGGGVTVLQTQVSRLRKLLGERIATSGRGYELRVQPGELDLERFKTLLAEAGATVEPRERSRLLRSADALWRGEALAGLDVPFAAAATAALEELRLGALEDRLEADLQRGLDGELVSELSALVVRYPLRERLRGQLILALYRADRQAEALDAYRQTRQMLDEQLGLEPSPALRELERAILRHDPSLAGTRHRPTAAVTTSTTRRTRRRVYALLLGAALAAVTAGLLLGLHTSAAGSAVLFDSLHGSTINPQTWDYSTLGKGLVITPTSHGVRLTITADATPADAGGVMKAHLVTYCSLGGPFDVQVDYRLATWPAANGVSIGMYAAYADLVRESDTHRGEQYVGNVTHFEPPDKSPNRRLPTQDTTGTLRIVRGNNKIEEQVRKGGRWHLVYTKSAPFDFPAAVVLEAWTNTDRFTHHQVDVEFSNFRVNTGILTCPMGAPAGCCPGNPSH